MLFKVAVLLLVYCSTSLGARCPTNCTCSFDKGGITCAGLSVFPSFEEEPSIIVFNIYDSKFPEIPPNAFANLTNVIAISIQKVTISKISRCAFTALNNLTLISITDANIATIESGSFDNLSFNLQASRIDMYNIVIQTIEPFAFNNIEGVRFFGIFNANITRIMPSAFNNMTLRKMQIYRSFIGQFQSRAMSNINSTVKIEIYLARIGELQCETFDRMEDDLGERFEYFAMDFNCDCRLAWFLAVAQNRSDLPLDKSRCMQPTNLHNRRLNTLNISEVCGDFNETKCTPPNVSYPVNCLGNKDDTGSANSSTTTNGDVNNDVSSGVSVQLCVYVMVMLTAVSRFVALSPQNNV